MGLKNQKNRNRVVDSESNLDDWMLTYGDMITLLMCFFILLISISKVDMALFEQIKKGLRSLDKEVKTPLAEIKQDLDSLLVNEILDAKVTVDLNRNGIEMEFLSSAFYSAGSAEININAMPIIEKVTSAIKNIEYYKFKVEIEGHTDNIPINTARFPSNWELSVARATNLVKYMIQESIEPDRLKAAGYADTKPKLPNVDSLGLGIAENQALNRRIVVRIQ
jgi:chemotaxis protein MotB